MPAEWDSVMQRIRIKDEVRLPFLKPEHQQILSTQPMSAWLTEIIDTFADYLDGLESSILAKLGKPIPRLRAGGDGGERE